MKTRNPKSRFDLSIKKSDYVVEVRGGFNPHPRTNVVVDKFVDTNYYRKTDKKVLKSQKFIQADGENMPFKDKEFDYSICNQVLEHVENPHKFLKEQERVSKRGYIEVPSLIGEYLFPKKSHKWVILEIDGKLVLVEKEKVWFKTYMDFGYLFLTYLPKVSVGYKILRQTNMNLTTVRYEWKDKIDYMVNPTDPAYLIYFTTFWDESMVRKIFPERSHASEFFSALSAIGKIFINTIRSKAAL